MLSFLTGKVKNLLQEVQEYVRLCAAAVRGATRVEVAFTMDADGILQVAAAEMGTGKATSLTIEAASGLAPDELARLSAQHR